ncbi:DUF6220 domain-containing protein [Halobacillus naozhouensis]|uniref:DUF6220 domain-containing protein n=1 Tax=Halobacillus naozhouensis TaxID=554880 RepID=A0ABY8J079_9BACI|nr:DUF6220 domain-containing protein [Halobacillus naozhouensis]WFT75442.1 DUF6220 domain-containing protein [Halobacillus naozhouensis]
MNDSQLTKGTKKGSKIFSVIVGVFSACIVVQIFIAGLAIFDTPLHWEHHRFFVHLFDKLALLILVLSFVCKMPASIRWQSGAMFFLVYLMYFSAYVGALISWGAAFHPVLAMLLFSISVYCTVQSWRTMREVESQ